MIPKDPVMLLSFLNLKLRDYYPTLEGLCEDLELNREEEIGSVCLIGLCTDICVISNALLIKAFLPEIPVSVDAACCAGVSPQTHLNALSAMKMCQIDIVNE